MNIDELTGAELDLAIGKKLGLDVEILKGRCVRYIKYDPLDILLGERDMIRFNPSTNWSIGGPLIEKFGLTISPHCTENNKITSWKAGKQWPMEESDWVVGETPLIAAMRCILKIEGNDERTR